MITSIFRISPAQNIDILTVMDKYVSVEHNCILFYTDKGPVYFLSDKNNDYQHRFMGQYIFLVGYGHYSCSTIRPTNIFNSLQIDFLDAFTAGANQTNLRKGYSAVC